ncbi:MAG: hypothetical protein GX425_04390 [Peptococcaceae bacterium]|nr:hypothetical protein [Peptococcaceae bacterium]
MPLFAGLFEHRGNEMLVREQASFYIREAQKGMMEMGALLQQISQAGHPDIAPDCARLQQIGAQVGKALEQVQISLK